MRLHWSLSLSALALAITPVIAGPQSIQPNSLSSQERAHGWHLLFNGHDLAGWQAFGGGAPPTAWQVRDGELTLTAHNGEMSGADLVTVKNYGAFELTLDWKVAAGGNSGVLYLARNVAPATRIYETGLEMQILDDVGHPDGKIPSHHAGALYDLTVPPPGVVHPAGDWNHARLLVEPGHIRQWLNGTLTADVSFGDQPWHNRVAHSKFATMPLFGTFPNGVIGLQDHGQPVSFRAIKLREIGPSALPS